VILRQALSRAREIFQANNIEDASLESEILLRYALKINRAQLYLDLEDTLNPEQAEAYQRLVERRLSGEPTAYITGHREFYGLDFYVDPRVLIPRPESEILVEKAIDLAQRCKVFTVADIGTGCGAIAISLALNSEFTKVYATDISGDALEVTRINCRRYGVADKIVLLQGDMLAPLTEPVDLIVANLPYVQESAMPQNGPASFEPVVALNGGLAGLEKIRQLGYQVGDKLNPRGSLLLEIGQGQRTVVTEFLRGLFQAGEIEVYRDLGDIERVVSLYLTS
jgi:release factor glutamine methyltransferase